MYDMSVYMVVANNADHEKMYMGVSINWERPCFCPRMRDAISIPGPY